MERYLIVLKSFHRMPKELEQLYRENVTSITVRKHDIIQPIGTINDCIYFVEKGLFQIFRERRGKKETIRFKKEDNFIISLKDFFPDAEKYTDGIEALEDGILWQIPGTLVSNLKKGKKYAEFFAHYSGILTKNLLEVEDARDCSEKNGNSNNYHALRASSPELLDRVPIRYLASYTRLSEKVFSDLHANK